MNIYRFYSIIDQEHMRHKFRSFFYLVIFKILTFTNANIPGEDSKHINGTELRIKQKCACNSYIMISLFSY